MNFAKNQEKIETWSLTEGKIFFSQITNQSFFMFEYVMKFFDSLEFTVVQNYFSRGIRMYPGAFKKVGNIAWEEGLFHR